MASVAELTFRTGTMDAGKSTLALQTSHNHAARGARPAVHLARPGGRRPGLLPARPDRDGPRRWSRTSTSWLYTVARSPGCADRLLHLRRGAVLTPAQVDQLAKIVDELQIGDVLSASSPTSAALPRLSPPRPGSPTLPSATGQALCWCGKRATHNARTENGVMVTEGEVIVVGDVEVSRPRRRRRVEVATVLCRQHHPAQDDRRPGPRGQPLGRATPLRLSVLGRQGMPLGTPRGLGLGERAGSATTWVRVPCGTTQVSSSAGPSSVRLAISTTVVASSHS